MSTLATALLVMVVAQSPDEAAKAEMKKMEGTWRLVSAISDGKPRPDDRLKAITIAIKADGTWVENDGKETFEATFTVDPAKSPKTANFVNKSGSMKGITCLEIYEIDGDTMKLCFVSVPTGKESTKERPSKFASEAGSGHYLCVMKREKNPPDPEKIVQEQVEAYNRHDIEAFLKTYSADIRLFTYPDQEMGVGLESMRKTYGKIFAENPKLKVEIAKRIVQGEYVIDHEQVNTGSRQFAAVAIYRVKDGKIIEVRFLK
jgi:uncharacterized protein (TIGR03067 family)